MFVFVFVKRLNLRVIASQGHATYNFLATNLALSHVSSNTPYFELANNTHLKAPAMLSSKQAVHVQQVGRKATRPVAAHAAANFKDDVAVVLDILRQQRQQQRLLQLGHLRVLTTVVCTL